MSDSLERLLDFTLNVRDRQRGTHEAEVALKEDAIRGCRAEFERREAKFSNEVRSLVKRAAEKANHHLATRTENCEFCEVTGYPMRPWYPGGPVCVPIVYTLRANGRDVGEALVIELTHHG